MMLKKPALLIPVENQVRELDAKLLLAYIAARRGFDSVIGFKRDVEFRIASFPPSIFLSKSLRIGNRKIWMARDPRDIAISRMLFRWHKGPKGSWKQYRTHLELVQKKERDPKSISFHVLCRYSGHGHWPMTTEEVVEDVRLRYQRMSDFIKSLGDDWFLFKYEEIGPQEYPEYLPQALG